MDTLLSSWVVVVGCLSAFAVAVVTWARLRGMGRADRAPRETPVVALVRRRRELMAQLRELAGDGGAELLQAEARRKRSSATEIHVLEAAVERAERNSAQAALQAGK